MVESRDELRSRLRKKIRDKRDNTSVQTMQRDLKADPTGSLLRLGVDDANLLKQAEQIVKTPQKVLAGLQADIARTEAREPQETDEDLPPATY